MAIKKISELENIDVTNKKTDIVDRLKLSRMELSFSNGGDPSKAEAFQFKSCQIKYEDLMRAFNYQIIGDNSTQLPDDGKTYVTEVDFYTSPTFHDEINAENGLYLNGDFTLNNNRDDVGGTNFIVNVSSSKIDTNNFDISATNGISINDNKVRINNENVQIGIPVEINANVNTTGQVNINGPVHIEGESIELCSTTVSCFGTAIFTQDIVGCALSARWADLAEMYQADAPYEPGTLVKFGGEKEITIATDEVNAVVTTKPGLVLGGCASGENLVGIALVGRVPVKVVGEVKKFDRLVLSDIPGVAKAVKTPEDLAQSPMGVALQAAELSSDQIGLVETVVKLRL